MMIWLRQLRHDAKATAVFGASYFLNKWVRRCPPRHVGPFAVAEEGPLELHVLTSERDHAMALWSLCSYYYFSRRADPLRVHDDGTLSTEAIDLFQAFFPGAQVIRRRDADAFLAQELRRWPLLAALRQRVPHVMKITDFPAFCRARRFLLLDSDVLFFDEPRELVEVAEWDTAHVFSEDLTNWYAVDASEVWLRRGFRLAPRINCGIGNVAKTGCDLARMEAFLRSGLVDIASCPPCIEQTLYALVAEYEGYRHLSGSYAVAKGPGTTGLVAKHYVGLVLDRFRTARDYFFSEGVQHLWSLWAG